MAPPESVYLTACLAMLAWTLNTSYVVCIVVGFGYLAVSFLLGQMGGGADHGDVGQAGLGDAGGDIHAELGGHDLHGVAAHEHGGHAAEGALHQAGGHHGEGAYVGPWSPLVLATFVFFFGCTGYLFNSGAVAQWGFFSLAPAAASGFVLAAIAIWVLNTVFIKTEGSSEPGRRELIGRSATVSVAIQPGHVGQVAYVARDTRFTAPARCDGDQPIDRDAVVTITRIEGGTLVVAAEPLRRRT